MLDELRDHIANYLSTYKVCIISTTGHAGVWAMPARYRVLGIPSRGQALAVECLLPRWGDTLYHLEQNPQVLMIVHDPLIRSPADAGEWQDRLRWIEYRGKARPVPSPQWEGLLPEDISGVGAEERYAVIQITPERIDLIDERQGWGARETLEV